MINLDSEVRVTEDQARTALLSFLSNHCCYGKGAAKGMTIKTMEYAPAFHYELQTFCEKRETAWTYSPLRSGEMQSMGAGGPPPLPWEIEEYPSQPFKDEVWEMRNMVEGAMMAFLSLGQAASCSQYEQREVLPPLPRHWRDAVQGLQRQGLGQVHQLPRGRLAHGQRRAQGKVNRKRKY